MTIVLIEYNAYQPFYLSTNHLLLTYDGRLINLHLGHILSVTMSKIFTYELELRLSVNHATRKVNIELAQFH